MGVKPDHWIIRMAHEQGMIEPFSEKLVSAGRISFGPSSYGYDFRLSDQFKIFRGADSDILDPKGPTGGWFEDFQGDSCVIPAGSFVLAQSLEYFRIPRDVVTVCFGKSTYARCGILVNVTPFEPEWEGTVTISISNTGPSPVRIYAKEGIAQVLFLAADETCSVSYRDRKGKYQTQRGIVLPKLKPEGTQTD
ncbi:MAG TPA: dCTP deaminase [Acidobacteriota bacterium]|nr:dCTP deaminase [Acidobacteriota bacterium]